MRSSVEIREELRSGIEKKDLETLHDEARVLKNYGVLSFEDYQKVRKEIAAEKELREFTFSDCQCEECTCGK